MHCSLFKLSKLKKNLYHMYMQTNKKNNFIISWWSLDSFLTIIYTLIWLIVHIHFLNVFYLATIYTLFIIQDSIRIVIIN